LSYKFKPAHTQSRNAVNDLTSLFGGVARRFLRSFHVDAFPQADEKMNTGDIRQKASILRPGARGVTNKYLVRKGHGAGEYLDRCLSAASGTRRAVTKPLLCRVPRPCNAEVRFRLPRKRAQHSAFVVSRRLKPHCRSRLEYYSRGRILMVASSPAICRLIPSCRNQLSALARPARPTSSFCRYHLCHRYRRPVSWHEISEISCFLTAWEGKAAGSDLHRSAATLLMNNQISQQTLSCFERPGRPFSLSPRKPPPLTLSDNLNQCFRLQRADAPSNKLRVDATRLAPKTNVAETPARRASSRGGFSSPSHLFSSH